MTQCGIIWRASKIRHTNEHRLVEAIIILYTFSGVLYLHHNRFIDIYLLCSFIDFLKLKFSFVLEKLLLVMWEVIICSRYQSQRKIFFFRYYLSSAVCVCVCVCVYVGVYVCLCDYSHTIQPRAFKFWHNIPYVSI